MKKISLLLYILFHINSVFAQDLYIGLEGYSTNLWVATIGKLLLPFGEISYAPTIAIENDAPYSFGEMKNGYARTFSNPIKRMGDCAIGLSGEYFFEETNFGLYGSLKYKSKEVSFEGTELNDRARYISPELGLRFRTGKGDDYGSTFGISAAYDIMFKYKGNIHDFGNSAVNSGFSGIISIGFYNEDVLFSIKYSVPFYNFYNNSYSPDGGTTLPFKGVERKISYITFSLLKNISN